MEEEILAKLDNLNERLNILEKVIYEEVMKPAQEAFDRFETDERRADFKKKYDEQLGPFNEKLQAIEGEGFDLASKAFDDYDAIEGEKPDADAYVAELVAKVTDQLDRVSKAFGADKEIDAKADVSEDGTVKTTIAVDGEPVADAVEKEEGAGTAEEAAEEVIEEAIDEKKEEADAEEEKADAEEVKADEEEAESEEDEASEEELEEYMKELEEDLEKQR